MRGSAVSGSRRGGDIVFFLGRWGREGTAVHGVRIVFHCMSALQTALISILYKQSLQWWFRCYVTAGMCWFGVWWGHVTDVSRTGCARLGSATRTSSSVSRRGSCRVCSVILPSEVLQISQQRRNVTDGVSVIVPNNRQV